MVNETESAAKQPSRATAMSDDDESSALYVQRSRSRLNLTQAELADQLGLERRSIIRFEQGAPLPLYVRLAIRLLLQKHQRKHRRKKNGADE